MHIPLRELSHSKYSARYILSRNYFISLFPCTIGLVHMQIGFEVEKKGQGLELFWESRPVRDGRGLARQQEQWEGAESGGHGEGKRREGESQRERSAEAFRC